MPLPPPNNQSLVPLQDNQELAQEENKEVEDKNNPRAYNELMDAYSLHQFLIKKGKTIDNTPEFASYKRTYGARWGEIILVIHHLEKILGEYNIPIAYIDGKKVGQLAMDLFNKFSMSDLLSCINNQECVAEFVKIPGRIFLGQSGKDLAVTYISKTWKMFRDKKKLREKKHITSSANLIKKAYKRHRAREKMKEIIELKNKQDTVII